MKRLFSLIFVCIASAAFLAFDALCEEYCVYPGGTGLNNFQYALITAAENTEHDTIKVVQGIYYGNFIYFSNKGYDINLEGGYSTDCTNRICNPENTVLDGQNSGRVLLLMNDAGGDVSMSGFTIRNGYQKFCCSGIDAISKSSGTAGKVSLVNNIITGNCSTNDYGGGACATSYGFSGGTAGDIILLNNLATGNTADSDGGGLYATSFSNGTAGTITITNNTVTNNHADGKGGGIYFWIAGNNGIVNAYNNIIWGNSATEGGDLYLLKEAGNLAHAYNNDAVGEEVAGDDWDSGSKEGFMDADPLFVKPGYRDGPIWINGDYRLQSGSPCIDAGNNSPPEGLPNNDLEGDERVIDGDLNGTAIVDMGADEYKPDGIALPISLYFPHVASNRTWETEICVINNSDSQTLNGIFKGYNNAGGFVSQINGVSLVPHARREITVGDEFSSPTDIGYITFESDSDSVVGYTKFYVEEHYRVAIPAVSEINAGDIYISHIASDSIWGTGVSLLNTTCLSKKLNVEFDNGETKTVILSANEHKPFMISSLFGGVSQPDVHSAVIKDAGGIIGLELFTSNAQNQMSGILLKDDTTTTIYYPHVASEDGWATGIAAYNPSDTDCNIIITPYTAEGTPLIAANDTIEANKQYIGVVSVLGLPLETAWLKMEASGPITGFELFTRTNLLAGYTGVGISGKNRVFAKIEKNGGTGIAFVNIENAPATVTIKAYDDSGNEIANKTFPINGYEKVMGVLQNLFSEDINNATYVRYSSDKEVVGFQLNISSDIMMLDALPGM